MEAKAFLSTHRTKMVCGWHGVEDLCVTPGGLIEFSGGSEISDPISESEMESDVL